MPEILQLRNVCGGLPALMLCLALSMVTAPPIAEPVSTQTAPEKPAETREELEKREAELLDSLFERLAKAENEENAELLESAVWQIWLRSGSDTIDLLMQQTIKAALDFC